MAVGRQSLEDRSRMSSTISAKQESNPKVLTTSATRPRAWRFVTAHKKTAEGRVRTPYDSICLLSDNQFPEPDISSRICRSYSA